ncbi:hypothetical protein [Phytohabitans rumicis]|uniref:Uncharacterized protein n=1 Tax=Phytohabitans rumicis TaxID=1076125 RepID=A0A6V8KSK5_9ACTN|nr:hypothetical protein [Phytohabitans rumicis]GFJ88123.1 hypothetical protein Prum_017650 [Phytohabitans rumicis]
MKAWLPLALGLLAVVVGCVWTLQGLGYLTGSVMTDVTAWAIAGPIVGVLGLILIAIGLRARRKQ